MDSHGSLEDVIGVYPYRMAFAGGWIDQPFVSRHNPSPPGSMVVVSIEPRNLFMARCGMGTSTRRAAAELWGNQLAAGDPFDLVQELYKAENRGKKEPSGSQDMIGILFPGISRLDYDFAHHAGVFPVCIESNNYPDVIEWLESVIYMVPVAPRPAGYNPLGEKNLDPEWIRRLGQTGKACYDAIVEKDATTLGASMNECMVCWESILPNTVRHATIRLDLLKILAFYQNRYNGAMYSGCGGGYLYVVSDEPVPGGFQVTVRSGQK
ncbi:MAG: hypothetical protein R3293_00325 [Candidatus Promineifilaceae bacterium]|nr:hypothetical protein [Candidatus Promineifilaceae bacterium]